MNSGSLPRGRGISVVGVQALIVVLVTCKSEEVPFKNKGAREVTTVLPFKVYGDFSRRSRAAYSSLRAV